MSDREPNGAGDPVVRAMAAMAFVRGVSVGKSHAAATAAGYAGTLVEWTRLRADLTEVELAEAGRVYVRTWDDVPLAAKKRRVEELAALFDTLVARLKRIEATERAVRKAAKKVATELKAAQGTAKSVLFHSAEWVRVAAEMRATLRDISLEMGGDALPAALDKLRDTALAVPEALRELQALLDLEVARVRAAAEVRGAQDQATGDAVSDDVRNPEEGAPL